MPVAKSELRPTQTAIPKSLSHDTSSKISTEVTDASKKIKSDTDASNKISTEAL